MNESLLEDPQSAYITRCLNHCLPTAPTPVVMATVWLKQAAKRNCGINKVFLASWLADSRAAWPWDRGRGQDLGLDAWMYIEIDSSRRYAVNDPQKVYKY